MLPSSTSVARATGCGPTKTLPRGEVLLHCADSSSDLLTIGDHNCSKFVIPYTDRLVPGVWPERRGDCEGQRRLAHYVSRLERGLIPRPTLAELRGGTS